MGTLDDFVIEMSGWESGYLILTLFAMMFAVALSLTKDSFQFFRTSPRVYFAGVVSQLIALPLVTLAICYLLAPLPSVALGMIIVACCPGGVSSNLLALFAKANIALSVSLTATSSLAAALLTPISIVFWASLYAPTREVMQAIEIDFVSFIVQTALLLALPIALGMFVRAKAPHWASRWQSRIALTSGFALFAIIIFGAIKYWDAFTLLGVSIIGLVIFHNLVGFATGWTLARVVGADTPSRRAITIETGIQNTGLALVILISQFVGLGGAIAVVGLWGTWHLIGGVGLVALWRRMDTHV